jgi:hypothetical protein
LPDNIIPYRRYNTESIEEAINKSEYSDITVAAEQSTIWRWREWFKMNAIKIMMALLSVAAVIKNNTETFLLRDSNQNSDNPIRKIKVILGRKEKWLNETVHILVNSSKWSFNRSAFLTG